MASTEALEKTKEAITTIRLRMQPVIEKLNDNGFEKHTDQAQATVALSIGMLKYIGARLQGKDQGRKADDPLRTELNNMKRVLADIKKRGGAKASSKGPTQEQTPKKLENVENPVDQDGSKDCNSSSAVESSPKISLRSSDSTEKSKKRKTPEPKSKNSKKKKR